MALSTHSATLRISSTSLRAIPSSSRNSKLEAADKISWTQSSSPLSSVNWTKNYRRLLTMRVVLKRPEIFKEMQASKLCLVMPNSRTNTRLPGHRQSSKAFLPRNQRQANNLILTLGIRWHTPLQTSLSNVSLNSSRVHPFQHLKDMTIKSDIICLCWGHKRS
jgi:hypothetical protein